MKSTLLKIIFIPPKKLVYRFIINMNNAEFIVQGNGNPLVMTQVLLHPSKGTSKYLDQ